MDAPAPPTPGWHPDPLLANTMRFWDGTNWTDQTAPAPAKPPSSRRGMLIVFGGIMAALVAVLTYNEVTGPSDVDCSIQQAEVTLGDRQAWQVDDDCR